MARTPDSESGHLSKLVHVYRLCNSSMISGMYLPHDILNKRFLWPFLKLNFHVAKTNSSIWSIQPATQFTADLLEACKTQVQIPCTTIHMDDWFGMNQEGSSLFHPFNLPPKKKPLSFTLLSASLVIYYTVWWSLIFVSFTAGNKFIFI